MFIESLTLEQLARYAELLTFVAFLGGLVGAFAASLIPDLLGLAATAVSNVTRGPGARVRDLHRSRRLHLTAAMTARRELRKLRHG